MFWLMLCRHVKNSWRMAVRSDDITRTLLESFQQDGSGITHTHIYTILFHLTIKILIKCNEFIIASNYLPRQQQQQRNIHHCLSTQRWFGRWWVRFELIVKTRGETLRRGMTLRRTPLDGKFKTKNRIRRTLKLYCKKPRYVNDRMSFKMGLFSSSFFHLMCSLKTLSSLSLIVFFNAPLPDAGDIN